MKTYRSCGWRTTRPARAADDAAKRAQAHTIGGTAGRDRGASANGGGGRFFIDRAARSVDDSGDRPRRHDDAIPLIVYRAGRPDEPGRGAAERAPRSGLPAPGN